MSFQDFTTDHLQQGVHQRRRQARDLVAKAWGYLDETSVSVSKIIPLLIDAANLIKPKDVPGQLCFKLPEIKAVATAVVPAPAPPTPPPVVRRGPPPAPVHYWSREGLRRDFDSVKDAVAKTGDRYNAIVASIREKRFTKRGFRWHWTKP